MSTDVIDDTAIQRRAYRHLAGKGMPGTVLYLAVWLLVLYTSPLDEDFPVVSWTAAALFVIFGTCRFVSIRWFESFYDRNPRAWLISHHGSAVLTGLTWGLLCALAFSAYDTGWTKFVMGFATAGLSSGATASLGSDRWLQRRFISALLLPTMLVCLYQGGVENIAIAILFVTQALFLVMTGSHQHAEYWAALRNTVLLERRAEELEASRKRAEAADLAKSAFLATMSHEIRTPMNGVLGMTELLQATELTSRQRGFTETIKRSAESLLRVINDILDFSKVEAGKLTLEKVVFDLRATCADTVEMVRDAANKKNLAISCEVHGDAPAAVCGDPGRLQQVLTNLLANAVKFTDQGSVRLVMNCLERTDQAVKLRFAVVDTGIGLAPGLKGSIFNSFTQGDAGTARRYGGSGLGLAIARQLVQLMGGEIAVESLPGEGAEFSFAVWLPLAERVAAKDGADVAAEPVPPAGTAIPQGLRVLLVEDNRINQVVAQEMLDSLGCEVSTTSNGFEALAALEQGQFDLVLMDCQMPELDGYETTRRIRVLETEQRRPRIAVIAVTANAMRGERDRVLAAGMDDYLSKPYTVSDLAAMMARWADDPVAPPASPEEQAPVAATVEILDKSALEALTVLQPGGGGDVLRRLIKVFLETSPALLSEMREAILAGRCEAAMAAAHSLKSGSANLGARALSAACGRIEEQARRGELVAMRRELPGLESLFDLTEQSLLGELEQSRVA